MFEKDDPSVELFRALFQDGSSLVDRAIGALEFRRASNASFAGTTARLLGFAAPQPDVAELMAASANSAKLPAAAHNATAQPAR